jgi:DNA mismatch repair protein MutL
MRKSEGPRPNKLNILSEDVTNLIDSNKTITKLSTVIKELIENSIDAGAKNISIFIKEGGLSLIEVKDDGSGIEKENFLKLCKRFSSSKLTHYDDLQNLSTFGFRGEALSILSYISHLSILSRTENSPIGYEAVFKNGKISGYIDDTESLNLKQIPCEKGSVIRVENIFYNNLIRKKHYDKSEETKDIVNLLSKYAFHFHSINFNLSSNTFSNKILTTCNIDRKCDELQIKRSLSSRLFNQEIQENLFSCNNLDDSQSQTESSINNLNLKSEINFHCYFTKPSANLDKSLLMIFLNNRLITNNNIKKLLDGTYSKFLIKHGNYFVYLNIECPSDQIDVNVKANKSEVIFMNEEKFLMQLKVILEENLTEEINSKNYYVGEYANFGSFNKKKEEVLYSGNKESFYAKDKVRVDTKTVSMEKYLIGVNNFENKNFEKNNFEKNDNKNFETNFPTISSIDEIKTFQDCLILIFSEIFNPKLKNFYFSDIIKNNFYVGYENKNNLAFIQFNTSLFAANLKFLLEEYFLYKILKSERNNFLKFKIKSGYKIENIIDFVEQNCINDFDIFNLRKIKQNKNNLLEILNSKVELLRNLGIIINPRTEQLEEIFLINLFPSIDRKDNSYDEENYGNNINYKFCLNSFKKNFLCYIPLIYYSIIEILVNLKSRTMNNSNMNQYSFQENENLNLILEIIKIYSHYMASYYVEYLSKTTIEEANFFLRDILFYNLKKENNFVIRKNIKEEDILEKIIDTETLYTVFERC